MCHLERVSFVKCTNKEKYVHKAHSERKYIHKYTQRKTFHLDIFFCFYYFCFLVSYFYFCFGCFYFSPVFSPPFSFFFPSVDLNKYYFSCLLKIHMNYLSYFQSQINPIYHTYTLKNLHVFAISESL